MCNLTRMVLTRRTLQQVRALGGLGKKERGCVTRVPCTSVSLCAPSLVELEPQLRDIVASYANIILSVVCSSRGWGYVLSLWGYAWPYA
jgi:hypothetical protein